MLTAIITFLGGNAFRMLWGELSALLTARVEHKYEIERLQLQAAHDAAAFVRQQDAIRLQHQLGIEVVRVQGEVDLSKIDAEIFGKGVELANRITGIWIVDLWNGLIRPALATLCMFLICLHFWRMNWTLDEQGWALVGAVLGIYVADRSLGKRGK